MKLRDIPPDRSPLEFHRVERDQVEIYVEIDEFLPDKVELVLDLEYEKADGQPGQKTLIRTLPCLPATVQVAEAVPLLPEEGPTGTFAFRLKWEIDWKNEPGLREHFVKIKFKVRRVGATSAMAVRKMIPDTIGVVGIDITTHPALTRIMHHEFAVADGSAFDPLPLREYLFGVQKPHPGPEARSTPPGVKGLTIQQRKLLIDSALHFPEGRLVIFVTLYKRRDEPDPFAKGPQKLRPERRMYADWTKRSDGVVPNARFSVFFCRDDTRMKEVSYPSISPITLICHTEYLCVCLRNEPTLHWLQPKTRNAPGVYNDRRPNEWLSTKTQSPVRFVIAALQPSSTVSNRGIWHAIYEGKSGRNIMPGNSLHGMINTIGCWMLFRNFNWPVKLRDELYYVYRKIERTNAGRAAVKAALKSRGYDFEAKDLEDLAEPPKGSEYSSSYDKFLSFDRNWAYLWFCHEIVGIEYYSDTDYWEKKKTVNHYKVAGREVLNKFPFSKAEKGSLLYHHFKHHDAKVTIGPNLFQPNALGIKTASDFSKDMKNPLTASQLVNWTWADVYFYKDEDVNADKLSSNDVAE